jgi:hypothetical protein
MSNIVVKYFRQTAREVAGAAQVAHAASTCKSIVDAATTESSEGFVLNTKIDLKKQHDAKYATFLYAFHSQKVYEICLIRSPRRAAPASAIDNGAGFQDPRCCCS